MKATNYTKEAIDFVDVRKNGQGHTVYTCRKCGFKRESNVYYEEDYKAMLEHAANCDGTPIPEPRAIQIRPSTNIDIEALNEYVKLLAGHIKSCVPNGDQLNSGEAVALARISMATDLSPFTGEVWYIPKKGPHVGIRGLRRKAKEQSHYSLSAPRPMTPEERNEHDVRDCDVGYICELWRHDRTREAAEINRLAGEAIIPIMPIIGVGIWRKKYEEIAQYRDDTVPHGKSPAWVAKKRAEADALNQAYDIGVNLPYADEGNGYLEMADAEDADWSVVPPEPLRRKVAANAERRSEAEGDALRAEVVETTEDLVEITAKYKSGDLELPGWAEELRDAIRTHDRASDPVDKNMVQQLKLSAERAITAKQFRGCVEIICGHPLEDVTFGEAAVLMNQFINGKDFEAKVVGLLS